MKRFWKQAEVIAEAGGWGIALDGRPVRTPERAPLAVASKALAEAIAAEWDAQGEDIDPASMPLTGLANAAIDRAAPDRAAFAAPLAAYAGSDLLCYRADGPAPLVARQAARWDPLLAWARETHSLLPLDTPTQPGDILVFDQIESDQDADLIAVVIARDERNVTEFAYVSGKVIRRGFVDPNRPALRRDHEGVIVNTFMRSGRRWPPKSTHYLAGELLANVLRPR